MADVLIFNGNEWLSLRGPAGADGAQGLPGADGAKGDTGPAGADGVAGEAGPKGDPGEQGPAGEQGPKGDAGSGVTIQGTATTFPPTYATGAAEQGDMWIVGDPAPAGTPNSATGPALPGDGIVFDGSAWQNVGPVRGEKGPVGPAGLPGEKGEQGLAGPAGSDGVDGADGAPGIDGKSQEVYGPQAAEPVGAAKGAIWFSIP